MHHHLDIQQSFGFQPGIEVHALRAITAVFRAAACLDTQQGADLDGIGIEMFAVNALGTKQ